MTRRLSDEDQEIWARVAATTRRLQLSPDPAPTLHQAPQPDPRGPPPSVSAATARTAPRHVPGTDRKPRMSGQLDLAPSLEDRLSVQPRQVDAALDRRLSRGKQLPEARLDLHGMTRDQARQALTGFLLSARARGQRLVLVITGKGRSRPDDDLAVPSRPGALRHDLPQWLQMPPLNAMVLDLRLAHRRHGGAGAFYIYLRRNR